MDDDLDLVREQDGGDAPMGRPWGLLAGALVIALVAVAGVVWVVGSLTGRDPGISPAAASPSASTPAPTASTPAPAASTPAPSPSPPSTLSTIKAPAPPPPTTPRPTVRRPTLPPPPPKPQLVRVPDVVGLRLVAATLTLRAVGFRVSVGGAVVPAPKPGHRRVRWQTPAGDMLAPRGSTVLLFLDSA